MRLAQGGRSVGGADETLLELERGSLGALVNDSQGEGAGGGPLPERLRAALSKASPSAGEDGGGGRRELGFRDFSKERYEELRRIAEGMATSREEGGLGPRLRRRMGSLAQFEEQCFSAKEAKEWLERKVPSSGDPDSVFWELREALLMSAIDQKDADQGNPHALFRLQQHAPAVGGALNTAVVWPYHTGRSVARAVAERLQEVVGRLLEKHADESGGRIDYEGLRRSGSLDELSEASAELQAANPVPLSRRERIAFFINVYNALIVHAIAARGAPSNLLERLRFYSAAKYEIGGFLLSAQEIEDGILRANSPSAASLGPLIGIPSLSLGPFAGTDTRQRAIVAPMDARVHFAINCGAHSCPPIRVYTPENLDNELQAASASYVSQEIEVDEVRRLVTLPKLFQYYAPDFGETKAGLLRTAQEFSEGEARQKLDSLLGKVGPGKVRLRFGAYDWSLNSLA